MFGDFCISINTIWPDIDRFILVESMVIQMIHCESPTMAGKLNRTTTIFIVANRTICWLTCRSDTKSWERRVLTLMRVRLLPRSGIGWQA